VGDFQVATGKVGDFDLATDGGFSSGHPGNARLFAAASHENAKFFLTDGYPKMPPSQAYYI